MCAAAWRPPPRRTSRVATPISPPRSRVSCSAEAPGPPWLTSMRRRWRMAKPETTVAELFHVRGRFHRSVQLERDFQDPHALDGYIVTEAMAQAFRRIA